MYSFGDIFTDEIYTKLNLELNTQSYTFSIQPIINLEQVVNQNLLHLPERLSKSILENLEIIKDIFLIIQPNQPTQTKHRNINLNTNQYTQTRKHRYLNPSSNQPTQTGEHRNASLSIKNKNLQATIQENANNTNHINNIFDFILNLCPIIDQSNHFKGGAISILLQKVITLTNNIIKNICNHLKGRNIKIYEYM